MKKIDILDAHIGFEANLIHLTFLKKKFKTSHRFYKEKGEFGVLKVSPYVSNMIPCLSLDLRDFKILNI